MAACGLGAYSSAPCPASVKPGSGDRGGGPTFAPASTLGQVGLTVERGVVRVQASSGLFCLG